MMIYTRKISVPEEPLDVGVFKSFKAAFSKACRNYIFKHPGRVITTDVIAALVGESMPVACNISHVIAQPIPQ